MSEVSKLAAVVNGLVENINTSTSDLDVASLWVGGTSGSGATQLTQTILNNLISGVGSAITSLTGDVTGTGPGATSVTISNGVVTLAKMATLAADSIIGNNTGSAATPIALTEAEVTAMLDVFTASLQGLAPASGGGTTNFLRADGTWAAPAGTVGANQTLSNLTNPTAINQDLLPDVTVTRNLGSDTDTWNGIYTNFTEYINPSDHGVHLFITGNGTAGPASGDASSAIILEDGPSGAPLIIGSSASSTADANPTNDIRVETGNKSAGTGNSGNIVLQTGSSSGGSQGAIQFQNGSQGTAGQIWTSTDVNGSGAWMAAPATGANTALSNLTTTSINQALIPNADATFDLGTSLLQWNELWTHSVVNSEGPLLLSGNGTIDMNANNVIDLGNLVPAASNTYDIGSLSEVFQNLFIATINSSGNNLMVQSGDSASGSGNTPTIQLSSGTTAGSATGNTGAVLIQSGVNANSSSPGNTGNVTIGSGDTNGSGASGNTLIKVGAASPGQRGVIQLQDGSEGTAGQVWTSSDTLGSGHWATPASGSVSSVGLFDGSTTPIFIISGSPVTSSGTLTFTLGTQSANSVFAGPASGSAAEPGFRSLVLADIPDLSSLYLPLAGGTMTGVIDLGGNTPINSGTPVNPNDLVNKAYVDNFINATSWKTAVLVASTGNLTLSGEQTIDGVATSASRVLVKDQTSQADNGIYVTGAGAWTRATDMSTWAEVPAAAVFVQSGTVNADLGWVCTSQPGGTLGTTAITFVQFSSAGAYMADGITLQLIGGVFSIKNAGVGPAQLGAVTDGVTLDQSGAGSTIEIKPAGVSATQLATGAADQATIVGGAGTPFSVAYAPSTSLPMVAGQAFTANTSYLVRMGINANSEASNQVFAADSSAAVTNGNFWAIGIANGGAAGVSIGGTIQVTLMGLFTLGSADTPFVSGDVGHPVWLSTAGGFSTTPPSAAGTAAYKVGIVADTNLILIDSKQFTGVN